MVGTSETHYVTGCRYSKLTKNTDINVNKVLGLNRLIVNATVPGAVVPIPLQDAYYLYIKNPIAESHGLLGHYCEFKLTLSSTKAIEPSELFAVESEVMKSFP